MPQSERSKIIIDFLKWLQAKGRSSKGGASLQECVYHITVEITNMGATQRRAIDYLRATREANLVYARGSLFRLTSEGENWLKRKVP